MEQRKQTAKKEGGSCLESRGMLRLSSSLKPYLIVFTASTCGLVIEIVAARILAPSIGISLYTWTSVIGVVLAGISIGNYIGGRLADRFPSPTTLGLILLTGSIFSLSILPMVNIISEAVKALPLVPRIVFLTTTLFLLPSLILGMVTPVVIKLRLRDLSHTGNVVGKIYALSTAGSIFGTFITGFVLIQWIGTRAIILLVALVLVFMALAFGNLWRIKVPAFACLALFLILGSLIIANRALAPECLRESNYFCIRVEDTVEEGQRVKALRLDALLQGYVSLEDPTFLVYGYQKVFANVATYAAQRDPSLRVLFIGGGSYTIPRYLEQIYPQSTLEVIEIDPEVTRVAFDYLGLAADTHIVTYNEDARMAVPNLPEDQYGLVIGDAFNDLSVPYHLTTREFNEQIRRLLKEDGIYAVNVVDKIHSGKFLRAFVHTLQQTFPYVYIIRDSPVWYDDTGKPNVVAGSFQPLSSEALMEANSQVGQDKLISHITPEETLTSWLKAQGNILLTDDYAPVDNLVAPLHLEKYSLSKAEKHCDAGLKLESEGELKEAVAEYDEAIRLNPYLAEAYYNRGNTYQKMGQFQRALNDYDEAIRLDPQDNTAYNNRGNTYTGLGQFQRAIQDFDQAIDLNSQNTEVYNNRGIAYANLGQFQRAIQDFNQAIRLNPQNVTVYFNRGRAYGKLGQFQPAIQDFNEVIRLNPWDTEAYYYRGLSHANLDEFQHAIQDYNDAIRLDPRSAQTYAARALAYTLMNMDAEAQQDFDRAVRLGYDPFLLEAEIEALKKQR
ncbi:fused MFS/spermidine synthase [Chloroflexota bacterium]